VTTETTVTDSMQGNNHLVHALRLAEQLANELWNIAAGWDEFARTSLALPMSRAADDIGLQLALTQGRIPIKQHLRHISSARKTLLPVDYYLQRAKQRELLETTLANQLHALIRTLARRLDQHAQAIVQATKLTEEKQQQLKQREAQQQDEKWSAAPPETAATH